MSDPRIRARIRGVGMVLPDQVVTNDDLAKLVDTSDEWIRTRTGIRERRKAAPTDTFSDLAVRAAREALAMAGVKPEDLDLIITGTVSGDQPCPSVSCIIAGKLGAVNAGAFDLAAACSGFIYGLHVGRQFIENGNARAILVLGGELLSRFIDYSDRNTCVLFGDGIGAAVLVPDQSGAGILSTRVHVDGTSADLIQVPAGGSSMPPSADTVARRLHYVHMRGQETFKLAVRALSEVSEQALGDAGIRGEDVDWYIPHQANHRIIQAVGERFHIPPDHIVVNIDRVGNTSAGSIPIALTEAVRDGRVKDNDVILMAAFGAGLTWGSAVVRF